MIEGGVLVAERIPEEKIQEVLNATDIVDIVSEYVQLEKKGRNLFGLCPFHGENTPSFSVSPEKQIFYCFGCGVGGNVFSFLMEIEGIPFQEAVARLADKAGIPLDITLTKQRSPRQQLADQMIQAHELLRKLYHHLLVHTKEGQRALEYLYDRGFTAETIEFFQIGYALDKWDFDYHFLKTRGFSDDLLEKSGLVIKSEHGEEYFDRFRDRIIFPIFDHKGNTVAFSGRVLNDADEPKYLNSPETLIFQKNRLLYNFHNARPNIRKRKKIVIFEGFADTIAAYRAGVDYGVGTMGTALTDEHVHIIKRHADRVILCFDNDYAGKEAIMRAGELLEQAGCRVEVAPLYDAKDPDEYIQKRGPELFRSEVIDQSKTFMSFKFEYYQQGKDLQHEGDRLAYIEQVLLEISKLTNMIEKDMYLRQLAERFSLSLDALKARERQLVYKHKKRREAPISPVEKNISYQDKKLPRAYYNAERILIAHMLKSVQNARRIQEKLGDRSFNVDSHQAIVTYLYAFYEEGYEADLRQFLEFLKDEELRKITAEIGMMDVSEELSDRELADYLKQMDRQRILLLIKEKEKEGKQAEAARDIEKVKAIARESIELRRSL